MAISFQIPADVEESLRGQVENLDQAAKEAILIELFRQKKLNYAQLARALGGTRLEVDRLLKDHEIYFDMTVEDVVRESEELGQLRNK